MAENKEEMLKEVSPNSKKATPYTLQKNRKYSIQELNQIIDSGHRFTINLPFAHWNQLVETVIGIVKLKGGFTDLMNRNQAVREKCFEMLHDENGNEAQRVKMLIDIAHYDSPIMALISAIGNGELPDRLKDWKPLLGMEWQMEAQSLIQAQDFSNLFWYSSYNELVGGNPEKHVHNRVLTQVSNSFPLEIDSPKDLHLEVLDHGVQITASGQDLYQASWDELSKFWNKKDNVMGVNGRILMDLFYDRDKCLKADGELNQVFAKTGKADSQISAFAQALDSIVQITGDKQPATKRWFEKVTKYREPRWKPKFKFKRIKDGVLIDILKSMADGKTTQEIADTYTYKADKVRREEEGLYGHSEKWTKLSNEYGQEDKGIEIDSSDDILD